MNEIDYLYEVVSNKVDKKKSWYYAKENIVFLTGVQFKDFKYVVEAYDNTKEGSSLILILSENKIHDKAVRMIKDKYGRVKYKPNSFRNIFVNAYKGYDFNVDLKLEKTTDDYSIFKLNI